MSKPEKLPPQHQDDHPGHQQLMDPEPETIRKDYRGSDKLKGKVALITGADSGIGRAVAVHFAREGADVAFVYYDEDEDARETVRMVEAEGRRCLSMRGDVRDAGFCRESVERTVHKLGKLDILVNNAAVQYVQKDIRDISQDQLERTVETNLYGYIYFIQAALDHMPEGSTIINTTSVVAYRGQEILLDYTATKGAILALTRGLAQNLSEKKMRVNGVAPGPIWTPLIPASFDEEHVKSFGQNSLIGRPGQPSEVAPAYVFLASQDASYITGQVIHVNGGDWIGS